jgi:hypothetical protein
MEHSERNTIVQPRFIAPSTTGMLPWQKPRHTAYRSKLATINAIPEYRIVAAMKYKTSSILASAIHPDSINVISHETLPDPQRRQNHR